MFIKKTRKLKKSRNSQKRKGTCKMGGKVIASGGYGCVLEPSIKCKSSSRNSSRRISRNNTTTISRSRSG